jgi:MFS family permease
MPETYSKDLSATASNFGNGQASRSFGKESSKAVRSWLVWGIAGLFYLYEMILRVSPSVMTQELMQDFQVSSTALGVLSSFYYYSYVALQIPCGLFVDKLGPRKIVTFSALLCAFGTFLFAESGDLLAAEIGRFLIGAGSACGFISCLKIAAEWFKPSQFALIAGLTNMMGTLGVTFGGRPLAMMVNSFGWRQAVFITALIGIPITVFAWLWIRDTFESQLPLSQNASKQPSVSLGQSLKIICLNKQIWLAGIIGGFMYLPISAFTELWAVPFLMSSYGINNELASTASVMLAIGMAVGGPLAAWGAEKVQGYVKIMKISTFTTGIIFIAIAYAEIFNLTTMFILLFSAGLTIGGQVLCFTCAKHNSEHRVSGTTMAFTNALVMMSAVIFQPMLGWILDLFWDGKMSAVGIRVYSHACYQMSILAVPACLILSWFLLSFVNETYRKSHTN